MNQTPWRRKSARHLPVVTAAFVATGVFAAAKWRALEPLLGLSHTFDFFLLALLWVGVFWLLGFFDRPSPIPAAPTPAEPATLDAAHWHLDEVRKLGLKDDHAGLVGGLYLAWSAEA